MRKRKAKEIIGKPIKEYKLPLIERLAYYRPFIWFVFATILSAVIVAPTIMANYENFWYYLLISPVILFFVVSLIKYIQFCYYSNRIKAKIDETVENEVAFSIYAGAPGTGKTFSGVFLSHEKAKYNWRKLKYEYWKICKRLKDPEYKPTLDEKEVIEAFEFYINNDGVPCWATNIPAKSKRFQRFSYDGSSAILKQVERAPYRLCGLYDEIGTEITLEMKDQRKANEGGAADVTDFCKFPRHFGKLEFIGCEQDQSNVYKDTRRVVGEIRVYQGKKWLLKPRFLCWLFDKLETHFTNKMYFWEAKMFSGFMEKFERYINLCGIFKFIFKVRSNTETGAGVLSIDTGEKYFVYIPRANEIVYRTRAFREAYKAKDKPIQLKAWTSLYMTDERARSMLKSENLPKKKEQAKKSSSSEFLPF